MTHDELVKRAGRWLRGSGKCGLVITEMASGAGEQPDAIGWQGSGLAILIECKTSRADFFVDGDKHFRRWPRHAMGNLRYFLTIPDLVKADEVPEPWGLMEVHGQRITQIKAADSCKVTDRGYEVSLLTSALRRMVCEPGVRGISCKTYTIESSQPRAEVYAMAEDEP